MGNGCTAAGSITISNLERRFYGRKRKSQKDFIVDTGPFAAGRWTTIDEQGNPSGGLKRNLGATKEAPTLPTRDDVLKALKITQYDTPPWDMTSQNSFRNQLEGFINGPQLHNRVHRWVGGQMGVVPTAPNDPVFFYTTQMWIVFGLYGKLFTAIKTICR